MLRAVGFGYPPCGPVKHQELTAALGVIPEGELIGPITGAVSGWNENLKTNCSTLGTIKWQ